MGCGTHGKDFEKIPFFDDPVPAVAVLVGGFFEIDWLVAQRSPLEQLRLGQERFQMVAIDGNVYFGAWRYCQ